MNDHLSKDFLLRRMLENFEWPVILLPVVLAFAVLGLMVLFRKENRFSGMIIPFIVVTVVSAIYVPLAISFKPLFSWWVVLLPVFAVALVYVVLMYVKDAQAIHPAVAMFLGFLRCTVYAILAFVFLLPGCQTYEKTETHSKVVFLFDVSASMLAKDGSPEPGQSPEAVPSRQDLVIQMLAEKAALMQKVLGKSPVTAYKFGGGIDDSDVLEFTQITNEKKDGQNVWTAKQWADWLKIDPKQEIKFDPNKKEELEMKLKKEEMLRTLFEQTNVPGSALQVARRESGNMIQAIIIFSDGQSNVGTTEAEHQFMARVNNPRQSIPVYTVGVGEYRQPASIRLEELQVPETVRPDDKFKVNVPVYGPGLDGETVQVTLEAVRVEDATGQPVAGEKIHVLGPKDAKFQGGGDNPRDTVEFEIDVGELKGIKAIDDKNGELEGTWEFKAMVPRHPREAGFNKKFHVSEPAARVAVQKKKLRVLIFAAGPGREYQFIERLLYREVLEKRVEMSVHLQTARDEKNVDQDVEADRLLSRFPDSLGKGGGKEGEKYMSLSDYDVIIAIDPDWDQLEVNQYKLLKDWVGTHAGGLIFVAGPVHSHIMKRPGGRDISALQTIYPVYLMDARIEGLLHDASRPYPLAFTKKKFDFLKLDEKGESSTAGWDDFFWGEGKAPEPGKDVVPKRGMHNYYPVEKVKPATEVIATFEGPERTRINDGKDGQPYIAVMPYGAGKTVYIGSAESWRMRMYKEAFHERFWIKLCRFASSGMTPQKTHGYFALPKRAPAGTMVVEAQLKGEDLLAMSRDARPTVIVKNLSPDKEKEKPFTFDLKAKAGSGEWAGWFQGSVKISEPGEYEFTVPIAGTNATVKRRLTIYKPDMETGNLKNDFPALFRLASDAKPVLDKNNQIDLRTREEIEKACHRPVGVEIAEDGKDSRRLMFLLADADAIPKCLVHVPAKTEYVKGRLEDLWDQGTHTGWQLNAFVLALLVPIIVGLVGAGVLSIMQQWVAAGMFLGGFLFISLCVLLLNFLKDINWPVLPIDFSFVLIVVVSLLSIEWLTRKLMKLA